MKIKLLIFAIISLASSAAYANQMVAVLEIIPQAETQVNISATEMRYLTDELRKQAMQTLPPDNYTVLTRDEILSLFPPADEKKNCIAGSCIAETGRDIGVEYASQGSIGSFGGLQTISIELYETMSGKLLGSIMMESENAMGLLAIIREKAPELFAKISKSAPIKSESVELEPALPPAIAPAVYTGSNPCHKEIFDLPSTKKDFNVQSFVKDLGVSVAKVKASCKTKFTCPDDNKVMDAGLTAGCIKQLPANPVEITELLKSIGMDLTVSAAQSLAPSDQSPSIIESNIEKEAAPGFKTSTWIAIGLDVAGAIMLGFGIYKHIDSNNLYDDYNSLPDGLYAKQYDNALKKANNALTLRDVGYIMGGALLTAGIAMHIWF